MMNIIIHNLLECFFLDHRSFPTSQSSRVLPYFLIRGCHIHMCVYIYTYMYIYTYIYVYIYIFHPQHNASCCIFCGCLFIHVWSLFECFHIYSRARFLVRGGGFISGTTPDVVSLQVSFHIYLVSFHIWSLFMYQISGTMPDVVSLQVSVHISLVSFQTSLCICRFHFLIHGCFVILSSTRCCVLCRCLFINVWFLITNAWCLFLYVWFLITNVWSLFINVWFLIKCLYTYISRCLFF